MATVGPGVGLEEDEIRAVAVKVQRFGQGKALGLPRWKTTEMRDSVVMYPVTLS